MPFEQICWIGLGQMGRGMAANLAQENAKTNPSKPLIVYNRTRQVSELFKEENPAVLVANSVEEAVRGATVVFTSLGNDAAVQGIYEIFANSGAVSGKVFVETSTISPEATEAIATKIISLGAEFVAAPVFGAPAMAKAGRLLAVLAGPSSSIDRIKPYWDGVMSSGSIEFRDQQFGKATLLKITGNTFILSMVETLGEGLVFAEKSGLGANNLHKFIENIFPGPYTAYSQRMLSADYLRDDPLFKVQLALKDARHAISLGEAVGVDLKIVKVAYDHLIKVEEEQGEKGDLPAIYGAVRKESGLSFDKRKDGQ